jgi:hypothetical protein
MTLRSSSPSRPTMPTAAVATARFCGEIILPSTPPDELAAASRMGERCVDFAAVVWSTPKRAFEDVSEPVTAASRHPAQRRGGRESPRPGEWSRRGS